MILLMNPLDKTLRREFIRLPFRLYRNTSQWVPPLQGDIEKMMDPARHPFYRHSTAAFFLAYRSHEKQPAGRLAILDHRNYNDHNHAQTAFFYLFECIDDKNLAVELFEAGFAWARQRGLTRMEGPHGFSVLDGFGLLVNGFQYRPAFGLPYNLPYYEQLILAAGFETDQDSVSGYLNTKMHFPERIHRASELIQKRRGLVIQSFQKRRDLLPFVTQLKDLYNGALGGTENGIPITDEEAKIMAEQLLWFADPRLIKIITKDHKPVGFLFAYPDISAAIQRTKGRVWPLGWIDLLIESKRTRWVNINGAGILPEYRGLGGTSILFSELQKSIQAGRFQHADLVQIGVANDKMQRELAELGVTFYKTHRTYKKSL
jgi:hypothetical protein